MAGVAWDRPPSALAAAFRAYGERVRAATLALGQLLAEAAQESAQANAPWTDRTGNARQSLHAWAEETSAAIVTVYLAHGMDYGKWLELAHGGRFQIIEPTLVSLYPRAMAGLRAVLGGR